MPNDSDARHRRSIRLSGYDYSLAGWYFVTIVTQGRACLFGSVVSGEMMLNDIGHLIELYWNNIPAHSPNVRLDAFVIMPNHIHGIIIITNPNNVGAGLVPARGDPGATTRVAPTGGVPTGGASTGNVPKSVAPTLGDIVGAFKSVTTVEYIRGVQQGLWMSFHKRLWQRNYYERIIRSERGLTAVRQYIHDNPTNWESDAERPASHPMTT